MEFNKAYNRNELVKFLRTSFLPEDFIQEETSLANPKQFQYTQQVTRLGECNSLELVVFEVMHSSVSDARVGLTKEAFRMLADEFCERALVFFVPQDDNSNYRFSLIEITLEQKEGSAKVQRTFSNPHRYSYYLGEGISYHTPNKYLNEARRVVSIEDLRSRFSVEVLTKAFYQELSDWYAWAVKIVRFPNDLKTEADNEKYNSEAMIRLITRLIFVWFIKQRKLVPDEFFDVDYISARLIKDFNPSRREKNLLSGNSVEYSLPRESHYYKGILQNLFFAMLNRPICEEGSEDPINRRFSRGQQDFGINNVMRHENLFIDSKHFIKLANRVPFLNGGLFDCLDDKDNRIYIDAFTDRDVISKQLVVPDALFFGDGPTIDLSEWYGDKKKKKVKMRGIIDTLKRYNFTVEENTPFDQDVSLDPELLGKVFENLLASYNPETQTTARKQTGSFYTPREIVQYMVDESLVAHLKRTVGDDLEAEYRKLIQYTDEEPNLTDEQRKAILQSIYQCKVLDPACGSGAFPMGMLQQMVHILNRIDPDNKEWKNMMVKNAISETSEAYLNATDEERKEMVADIERSFNENVNRPDYARKLYLIENCIYGVDIQPIAIQISKLRFFISLVVDQKTNDNPVDNFGIRPLPNLEAKFVSANTLIGVEKKDANLFTSEAILKKEAEMKDAKHRIFGAKTVKTKRKYKERVAEIRSELATMLEDCGAVGNEDAQQLASWDMFDQNTASSFFDPEWMFGIDCGFDIVIGNPPYVLISKSLFKTTYERFYRYQEGKIDLYRLFIEKGTYLCSKQGCLSYITPNTFLSIKNCARLRHFLIDGNSIVFIDNYDESVFDASVNSIVFLMLRNSMSTTIDIHLHSSICVESSKLDINKIKTNPLYEISINADDVAFRIKDKILKNASLLKDIKGVEICLGAQPYHNTIHTAEEMKSKFLHSEIKVNNNYVRDYGGKHFSKYIVDKTPSRWIDYSAEFYTKPDKRFFTGSRIVIREIPNTTLICAYIETFALFNKSVFIIRCSYPSVKLKYILAVLNSKAVGYYISAFGDKSKQTLFPRVSMKMLKQIPIPKVDENEMHTLISLVDSILSTKKAEPQTDTSALENEIDKQVYHLYGLTYDEVLIVDPETGITKEEYERG